MRAYKLLCLLATALLLSACVSSTYLAKQQYILQTPQAQRSSSQINANINVMPMLAAQPYDDVQFVYRLKGSRYLSDYYNIFMTPPANQLSDIVTNYLRQSQLFNNTNNASLIIPGDYQLKTQLLALYADYSNDKAPSAVMSIQFIILKGNRVIFHHTLTARTRLAKKSTPALVDAWNHDVAVIMSQITQRMADQLGQAGQWHKQMPQQPQQNKPASKYNFLQLAQ